MNPTDPFDVENRTSADRSIAMVILTALLAGCLWSLQPVLLPNADQQAAREAVSALVAREGTAVAFEWLKVQPQNPLAVALAAEAASQSFQHAYALSLYQRLPEDGGAWELLSQMGQARRCRALGQVGREEQHLRRVLELDPTVADANHRLAHLLQVEGRTWESGRCYLMQILRGKCRGDELLGVAITDRFFESDEDLERVALVRRPREILIELGEARRMLFENRFTEAEALLREIVQLVPWCGEAQGRLGRLLADRGDAVEFQRWVDVLPDAARSHPEVWFAQGVQSRYVGDEPSAVHCFLQTLRQSPDHLAAHTQIAQALGRTGHAEAAQSFAVRGELLAKIEITLNLQRSQPSDDSMQKLVRFFHQAGRHLEAAGWEYVRRRLGMTPMNDVDIAGMLRSLRRNPGQHAPGSLATEWLTADQFPAPDWRRLIEQVPSSDSVEKTGLVAWGFEDDAERLGVSFQYYEGTTEATRLQHIFNVVGGGLAAIDFDRDGWIDLHIAQACDWQRPDAKPAHLDALYRNLNGTRFEDVATDAGIVEAGFSHGVTAADFDQDGFPDLHICNLGGNRLFRNNGDGTFDDVTDRAGIAGEEWSISSVVADFSGDGYPDLYVANYSDRAETEERRCRQGDGRPMACTPDVLTAEFDRLYLSRGDGTFEDVSSAAGIRIEGGRGLGLIAWDFHQTGRLGLFVANDTSQNFMFQNTGTDERGVPVMRETGIVEGVAFDGDGNAQASMGVAAGDANGDGQLDLFITNFFADSNTLYSQNGQGSFNDLTRRMDLRDPSFWMLGFGTQFADFDLDGWPDLVVTNGHVDQRSSSGTADRMPAQLFHNLEGRRFVEISAEQTGPYFSRHRLGRGLAVLDWNRDGRTDFAVSHLHDPVSLVTNRTVPRGKPVVLQLIGTASPREPVGALVRVQTSQRNCFRMVTAGSGYLASNQPVWEFALVDGEDLIQVEVRWPGGATQRWNNLLPGSAWYLIENEQDSVRLFDLESVSE